MSGKTMDIPTTNSGLGFKSRRNFLNIGAILVGMKGFNSLLGFGIGLMIANILGANESTDALFVAMFIPVDFARHLPRMTDIALVPAMLSGNKEANADLPAIFMGWWFSLLIPVCLLLIVTAPWIIKVMAPGMTLAGQAEATRLLRMLSPSLLLIGLFSSGQSFFIANRKFIVPTFAQLLWRVTCIVFLVALGRKYGVKGYAIGLVLASLTQLLTLLVIGKKSGVAVLKMVWPPRNIKSLKSVISGAAISWLIILMTYPKILIDRFFLSLMDAGSISLLYYADRLAKAVPLLMAASFFSLFLPGLSESRRDSKQSKKLHGAIGLVSLGIGIPFSLSLIWAAGDIVEFFLVHGRFQPADAPLVAWALRAFALSTPALICSISLKGVFAVDRDYRSALGVTVAALGFNALADALLYRYGIKGIAFASSITTYATCIFLWAKAGLGWPVSKDYIRLYLGGLFMVLVTFATPWKTFCNPCFLRVGLGSTVAFIGYGLIAYPVFKRVRI